MTSANLVTLAGKPLSGTDAHRVINRQGPYPAFTPIVVDQAVDKVLATKGEFVEFKTTINYFDGTKNRIVKNATSHLWPIPTSELVDDYKPRWLLTDLRFFLRKLWVISDFSMRRPINEFTQIQDGPLDPFNRVPKLAYLPHTQRLVGPANDPRFNDDDNDETTGTVWTAKQAVVYLLRRWIRTRDFQIFPHLPVGAEPGLVDESTDNGSKLVGFRAAGPWPSVMRKLLRQAHLGLSLTKDLSQFRLFDLAPVELGHLGGFDGMPRLRKADNTNERPRRLRVYFRTEREMRFNYLEQDEETIERGKRDLDNFLVNVAILPQDVQSASDGKIYRRGTVLPIQKVIQLWNEDVENPPPFIRDANGKIDQQLTFSLEWIRKFIMSPAMAMQMTLDSRLKNIPDDVFAARASVLYNSFRTLYQINPALLDFIETLKPERTAIADNVTGKRAASTVVCDHFVLYTARYFGLPSQFNAARDAGANVYGWKGGNEEVTDFGQLPFRDGVVSPYRVSIVNKQLGVIQISPVPDITGNYASVIPSLFSEENIPYVAVGSGNRWQLNQMPYERQFRLSTILTATLRAPNDAGRFWTVDKGQVGNGNGPVEERFFGLTHAGIEWVDKNDTRVQGVRGQPPVAPSELRVERGKLHLEGGRLINPQVINNIADAMYQDSVFENQDRFLGSVSHPGIDKDFVPQGQVNQVAITHQDGQIYTTYDARNPEATPPLWELLDSETQALLFRLEDDTVN